jgi:hypothetical protein
MLDISIRPQEYHELQILHLVKAFRMYISLSLRHGVDHMLDISIHPQEYNQSLFPKGITVVEALVQ